MFVDTAKVHLEAGKGGDGAVSFRHEIYIPKGGPDGGNGGNGGSIIFKADKDTNTLIDFRFNPILKAKNGKNGAGQRAAGRSGEDLIVEVPIGTVVWRVDEDGEATRGISAGHGRGEAAEPRNDGREDRGPQVAPSSSSHRTLLADLTRDGQTATIAHGGDGGFGNAHFKSSTRQTPRIAEVGEPGEILDVELELKLLADVGLVGLPNAGKSTFLSVVTNAKPEIADYAFTTITPNLGVATVGANYDRHSHHNHNPKSRSAHDLLIADIPGLIEGASEGKGLGHAFLRHVDRTAVLLHLVDVYNEDAGKAYATIRHELEKYSDLKDRPEVIALTKCEGLDDDLVEMQKQSILSVNPHAEIMTISSLAHQGLDELLHRLLELKEYSGSGAAPRMASGEETENSKLTSSDSPLPIISLSSKALKSSWQVTKTSDNIYHVTGEKIEKFARRTDLANYASINRLRDILKKLGIRAELTNQGAGPDSIIEIAGKEFTLVEDY